MKGRKGNKAHRGQKGADDSLAVHVNPKNELRFFKNEGSGQVARLRRRLTTVVGVTATSGVNFLYAVSSGSVTTATEWAGLSPNYQQYRVRAIRAIVVPKNYNNMGFAATVWYPGSVCASRYPSGSAATTLLGVFAEGGAKLWTCSEQDRSYQQMATMKDNPDAALFTDCNAGAPPALSQYGVQFIGSSNAPAIYNGVVTHDAYVEWDVEFISRN